MLQFIVQILILVHFQVTFSLIEDVQQYNSCFDKTHLCFGLPSDCVVTKSCLVFLKTRQTPEITSDHKRVDNVYFHLVGKATQQQWIAAALSFDNKMGSDSVTECFSDSTSGSAQMVQSWNVDDYRSPLILEQGVPGIDPIGKQIYENGTLNCNWKRNRVTFVEGKKFDLLMNEFNVMIAIGNLNQGTSGNPIKSKHFKKIVLPSVRLMQELNETESKTIQPEELETGTSIHGEEEQNNPTHEDESKKVHLNQTNHLATENGGNLRKSCSLSTLFMILLLFKWTNSCTWI